MAFPALIRIDGKEKILIDRPSIIVGRSRQRADFQIDDPTVSSVHCELKSDPSGLTVRDLSRHGTLVNGRKVDSARLHEGDIVEIGGFRFHVTLNGAATPARSGPDIDGWFVRLAGIELGPMPWDELAGMARRDELQQDDLLRAVSDAEWKSAGEFQQLFDPTEVKTNEEAETAGSSPTVAEQGGEAASNREDSENQSGDDADVADSNGTDDPPPREKIDPEDLPPTGWHYRHNNSELGPVDLDGLAELAQAELLLPDDAVRIPGSNNWIPANRVPGVFSTGIDEESVDVDSVYDDASFADLDDETAKPVQSKTGPPVPPLPRSTDSGSLPDHGSAIPLADSAIPALPSHTNVQTGGRASLIEKLAAPAIAIARQARAHRLISGGVLAAAIAVWLMLPGGERHEAYVSGQIQLDGSPLKNATITFVEPNSGWGASANLDEEGRFEIATLRGGLKPGSYHVSLMPAGQESEEVIKELQRQYRQEKGIPDDEPSTMETGDPGNAAAEDPEQDEKPSTLPRGTIPIQYRSAETSGLNARIQAGSNDVSLQLMTQ